MSLLGEKERLVRKARKEHACNLEHGCTIKPGEAYFVGVTLPGSATYRHYDDDYETIDWPFTVTKACVPHYNAAMSGEL